MRLVFLEVLRNPPSTSNKITNSRRIANGFVKYTLTATVPWNAWLCADGVAALKSYFALYIGILLLTKETPLYLFSANVDGSDPHVAWP